MTNQTIDGLLWAQMVNTASQYLEKNKAVVDALNVFPVPDGDTGTNMSLTLQSAARSLNGVSEAFAGHFGQRAEAMSQGALLGARGNSGVISSQILSGFSQVCRTKETADAKDVVESLEAGVAAAYKAVMKPVEGTILTVSKAVARGAREAYDAGCLDILALLEAGAAEGLKALELTPTMLPILKQAGVVDAGGQGFLFILRGLIGCLKGEELGLDPAAVAAPKAPDLDDVENLVVEDEPMDPGEIQFGYCTEFVVKNKDGGIDLDKTRDYLSTLGDCVLVVGTPSVMKVHVHTNQPGKALDFVTPMGSLHKMKIDNMREEAEKKEKQEMKKIGLIAVACGPGIEEIFKSLGVHRIITGGQTMNPSTQDFVEAIKKLNAREIIILPNNSNIIMAATQAAKVSDRIVHIVPTKTVPQGIGALLGFNEEETGGENARRMTEAAANITTLEITYAVRDANYEDHVIKEGDILGMVDGKLALTAPDRRTAAMKLFERCLKGSHELVTIYYGQEETQEEAEALAKEISALYDWVDIEVHQGGQPLYYYLISIE